MASTRPTVSTPAELIALLTSIVRALDDKKAEKLRVLHVTKQSSITDYLVLATGTSDPHLRALRVELEKVIDANGAPIAGMEMAPGSGWLVVDAYQVMVHLFRAEQRDMYRLENLWKDATELKVADLLAPVPAAAKKKAAKKLPAKKAVVKKALKTEAVAKKTPVKKAVEKTAVAKKTVVKKTVAKKSK
jgi:ribosome-associated protein